MAKRTTSPAFQFYPRDFLSSSKVDRMSMTERGVYITLLSRCWLDDGLPTDLTELAALVRMKRTQFDRMWSQGQLQHCFAIRSGRFVNDRLDAERKKQSDYKRRQSDKANMRWQSRGNAGALPESENSPCDGNALYLQSSIAIASASSKEKKDSSEPPSDSTPAVLSFPVVGDPKRPEWALTQERVDVWAIAYPSTDVLSECRKAAAWVDANRDKRKTAKGMPVFLVNWLNRAVSRGGSPLQFSATGTEGRGRTGAPPPGKYAGIEEQD